MFAAPLAPHLAARAEGRRVDGRLLRDGMRVWRDCSDVVIVEGAGGLMSPISDEDYNADLAAEFGYPLVVVAANELGTINATLQTLIAAGSRERGAGREKCDELDVAGIVLNSCHAVSDLSAGSNADELARRCTAPVLAIVGHGGGFDREVDWRALAGQPAGTGVQQGSGTRVQNTGY
jgi:dethiobiotin synthetase